MNEIAFMQFARQHIGQPFSWGQTDCASIVIRAYERIGVKIAGICWSDEAEARAVMSGSLPSAALRNSGFKNIPLEAATVGDVMIATADDWPECLHLCLGRVVLCSTPSDGVALHRRAAVLAVCHSVMRLDHA